MGLSKARKTMRSVEESNGNSLNGKLAPRGLSFLMDKIKS